MVSVAATTRAKSGFLRAALFIRNDFSCSALDADVDDGFSLVLLAAAFICALLFSTAQTMTTFVFPDSFSSDRICHRPSGSVPALQPPYQILKFSLFFFFPPCLKPTFSAVELQAFYSTIIITDGNFF